MAVPDDDSRIWTAAELYRLTPAECDAVIRRRHQKTLTFEDLDPAFAKQVRATGRRLVEAHLRGKNDNTDGGPG
jgi:hypothetical protein